VRIVRRSRNLGAVQTADPPWPIGGRGFNGVWAVAPPLDEYVISFHADGLYCLEEAAESIRVVKDREADIAQGSCCMDGAEVVPGRRRALPKAVDGANPAARRTGSTDAYYGPCVVKHAATRLLDEDESKGAWPRAAMRPSRGATAHAPAGYGPRPQRTGGR
jgi:hypothetical protein